MNYRKKVLNQDHRLLITIYAISLLILFGCCRWIKMTPISESPKQGDNIEVKITVGKKSELKKVDFKINNVTGTTTTIPHTVSINTCKESGIYYTTLTLWGEATYNDGEKKRFSGNYDLTVGNVTREDSDLNYNIYVAHDDDGDKEDLRIGMANAFMDEFNYYSESQYYWAEPRFYTTQCINFANNADMTISFGHGSHHQYKAGKNSSDWVNIANTSYGNCAQCFNTGDLEYLVFGSCQTLSMDNNGGYTFWHYWFHEDNNKIDKRPFTGLHMVLGFRTNHRIVYWIFDNDSEDFFEAFAENMDDGMKIIDAWQEAAGDELSFSDGKNRTAVIYLLVYENANIFYNQHDYIYDNSKYYQQYIDYWE
jgi:hypothetical protein